MTQQSINQDTYFRAVCVTLRSKSNPDHILNPSWNTFPIANLDDPTSIPNDTFNKLIKVPQKSSSIAAHFLQLKIKRHLYMTHSAQAKGNEMWDMLRWKWTIQAGIKPTGPKKYPNRLNMYHTSTVGRGGIKYFTPRECTYFFPARQRHKGRNFSTFLMRQGIKIHILVPYQSTG